MESTAQQKISPAALKKRIAQIVSETLDSVERYRGFSMFEMPLDRDKESGHLFFPEDGMNRWSSIDPWIEHIKTKTEKALEDLYQYTSEASGKRNPEIDKIWESLDQDGVAVLSTYSWRIGYALGLLVGGLNAGMSRADVDRLAAHFVEFMYRETASGYETIR